MKLYTRIRMAISCLIIQQDKDYLLFKQGYDAGLNDARLEGFIIRDTLYDDKAKIIGHSAARGFNLNVNELSDGFLISVGRMLIRDMVELSKPKKDSA